MRSSLVGTLAVWAAVALITACGAGDDGADDDASSSADAAVDAALDAPDTVTCADPDSCPWLEEYLREVVGKLTGQREAAPGVTITRRATSSQRDVARQYLVDELTRLGLAPTLHDYGSGKNVVVHLPSTTGSTQPRIVIGAHFDGVSAGPAAADNGTGTAIVMAAARYLGSRARRDRAIDLVLFDQEEAGLIGSTAYAIALQSSSTPVEAVHNVDMVSHDSDHDTALELWSPSPSLETLYRAHAGPRGVPISAVTFASSDHQSFLDRGFTTVGVCEEFVGGDYNPNYHRVTDTYDNVDFAYTTAMTRLLLEIFEDQSLD